MSETKPILYRVVLIGDASVKAQRERVAELLNTSADFKARLPKGAVALPGRFANSQEFAKTIADGPSMIVAIDNASAPQEEGDDQQQNNQHLFRYWYVNDALWSDAAAAAAVVGALNNNCQRLRPTFSSSRSRKNLESFLGAIREGLAADGGLFTPETLPTLEASQLAALSVIGRQRGYAPLCLALLEQLVDVFQLPPGLLSHMIAVAYKRESWATANGKTMPLRALPASDDIGVGEQAYVAELFHGPTAAFKDFALQLFPHFFAQSILESDVEASNKMSAEEAMAAAVVAEGAEGASSTKYMILAATSGDTGVSAIRGFMNGAPHVKVMVLYPKAGVSPVQRQQMLACHGGNVSVLGVDGDFDLCQTTVKKIFGDAAVNAALAKECGTKLSSANSINWGRLLPQIVYYFSSASQLPDPSAEFDVVVPTGNFGNILSGYFAKQLGCRIRRLVLASNTNDVLCDFIRTGVYDISGRTLQVTASPSIDILKASNVERFLYYVSGYDSEMVAGLMKELDAHKKFTVPEAVMKRIAADFVSYKCTEKECAEEVQAAAKAGVLLDPHTAVALSAAKQYRAKQKDDAVVPLVIMSTAQWAKFPDAVAQSLDEGVFPPPAESNKLAAQEVPPIFEQVCDFMDTPKRGGTFVAQPLAKTFEDLGKHEAVVTGNDYDDIVSRVMTFAKQ